MAALEINGRRVEVDDSFLKLSPAEQEATVNEIAASFGSDQPSSSVAMDMAKSAATGLAEGVIGNAGSFGDLRETAGSGVVGRIAQTAAGVVPGGSLAMRFMPSSAQIRAPIEAVTGPFYQPQTVPGEYARTIGEFAPNAIAPGGGVAGRVVGGVLAPAIASETAGQLTRGSQYEGIARVAAALAGGVAGNMAATAWNNRRASVPGMSTPASKELERALGPANARAAETRLAELGPDAMLLDATESTRGLAQGVGVRGERAGVVDALTARQRGANARLTGELDDALGPAVSPASIERSLTQQQESLSPLYQQVTGLNNPVNLTPVYDRLRMAIPEESGATQNALRRVLDMVAPEVRGQGPSQRIPRTSPREVLNVRQALDDELKRIAETPKAHRAVLEYRKLVDDALAEAVPDIKVLDQTYSNLAREGDAVRQGRTVLRTGPEAVRPEDLIRDRQAMPLAQREAMKHGVRAELDRIVGTKANDITALKQTVMSDGDWNRVKLAEVFGGREADRIMKAVNREVAFEDAYKKIVENSQTAQRQQAAGRIAKAEGPPLTSATIPGLMAEGSRKAWQRIADALVEGRRSNIDRQLGDALTSAGVRRDELVRAIREAAARRQSGKTVTRDYLVRMLMNMQAAR